MYSRSSSASSHELRSRALRSMSIDSRVQGWTTRDDELVLNEGPDRDEVVRMPRSKGKRLKSPVPSRPGSSRSPSREGSHRSRSPSRAYSRSSTRSRSPLPRTADPGSEIFNVPLSKSRQVRQWVVQGLSKDESKRLRSKYTPAFEENFELLCPKLDEKMVRFWKQADGKDWRSKFNDFQEKTFQSVQFQLLDVFSTLVKHLEPVAVSSTLLDGVETSLKLLGNAFASVSKLRRSNAMRHVNPDLLPLLKDDRSFSSREYERLFGEKFLNAMVKYADDFEKVKKLGAVAVRLLNPLLVVTGISALVLACFMAVLLLEATVAERKVVFMDSRIRGTQALSSSQLLSRFHRAGMFPGHRLTLSTLFAAVWLFFSMLGACFVLTLGFSLLLRMVMWLILSHLLFNILCRRGVLCPTKCGRFVTPKWNPYWLKVLSVKFRRLSLAVLCQISLRFPKSLRDGGPSLI